MLGGSGGVGTFAVQVCLDFSICVLLNLYFFILKILRFLLLFGLCVLYFFVQVRLTCTVSGSSHNDMCYLLT